NGSGRSTTPSTTLKIAELAPMPIASVKTAIVVNAGARTKPRREKRKSWKSAPILPSAGQVHASEEGQDFASLPGGGDRSWDPSSHGWDGKRPPPHTNG